ncbi:AAA-ATPase At2g46620-like [Malania oleifera]|uniref:AAA-ATPase At2g46620-like n=1 Tax=Malania oleifera TaxID=397392 RepID=UPI0025AEABE1|nr:AAA-ATPase At2g46620-like [Malania oleifera]
MISDNPILVTAAVAGCAFFFIRFFSAASLLYTLRKWWISVEDRFHAQQCFKVPQYNDVIQENQLYRRVSNYLSSLTSLEDSDFTNLFATSNDVVLSLDANQTVRDTFLGARMAWTAAADSKNGDKSFVLRIRRSDKRRVLRPYLQHIHAVSEEIEQRRKEVKLFLNFDQNRDGKSIGRWRSVPFSHPATLDTVVLNQDLKNKLRNDLELFLKSKQYYHRLGRVWKRSYLLYGPSGTGKSSFVAAMARFLCYDVYDVDLSRVSDDLDLKLLLLQTTSKSLIVVEDLDRFLAERSKSTAVSTSGVLNFMDGLFSCCGEERVMVFTMNGKDQIDIDPTVLRPGRIDVRIHFPLCDFPAFRALANTHLGVKEHKLFPQVEEIFQSGASLSPAEIGEIMISNRNSPNRALKSVINALQTNGDGRESGTVGQRLTQVSQAGSGQSGDEPGEPGTVVCRESIHMVREFRKLYGLFRMRSGRKDEPFELGSAEKEASRHGS